MIRYNVQALIFDIDGVITDGKKYMDGTSREIKSIAYKDLDAINEFQKKGILVGCISGEDTEFSRMIVDKLDYQSLGTKNKRKALEEFSINYDIENIHICYIGDGKYDVEALKYAGLSVCPHDAIQEVKKVSDIILDTFGGQGCIAELYTMLYQNERVKLETYINAEGAIGITKQRIYTHYKMIEQILNDEHLHNAINIVSQKIINSYRNKGQLFFCGNGGSAADAQHLAAELVGRFYLERRPYSAEALTTNTSVITALANDYDYNMIFSRQIEAKGRSGDVLIGITTSGKSENILRVFQCAKKRGLITVVMAGKVKHNLPILEYTDYIISIPSDDTPRIQEGHILVGHIICEIIESKLTEENEKNE